MTGRLIEKSKKEWGVGLATAAVGGAVANQVPTYRRRTKKKGVVKKAYTPTSTDPFFNHEAAQQTFDLIMKMDDDTAEVFCTIVASDLLEREIENNMGTLQRHLNEVVEKQLTDLKHAVARRVAKGDHVDEQLVVLDALVEEIHKADIPNWEFENKIRRDSSSGRFQVKVNPTNAKKPINENTAAALGVKGMDNEKYSKLSPQQQAKYQHDYMQVANFLDAVAASTGGAANNDVLMHYKGKDGSAWVDRHIDGKPDPAKLLDEDSTLIGMEARPTTLNLGGTAFSLAGAMGNTMSADTVGRVNAFDSTHGQGQFANAWTTAGSKEPGNSNARLYGRTAALGGVASTVGPPGSKVQLAGKMAEIVGQYGPQAEQVLGPSARKTAYRYRGTEKTPDKRLVNMYAAAIEQNKRYGPVDPWEARDEAKIRTIRQPKSQFGSESAVRAKGTYQRKPDPGAPVSLTQMVAQRERQRARTPEWGERELGRRAVEQYLTERLPRKDYYKLHLEAGNTPPSEGVIINRDGQIASQASGYGDDHYLPFNLKNLKDLKGGEYVRSRSVGGLTSEDIYTGLISGARRVTVVSRSGTFTMEFQPDFRGGRRHNDKARRMTRRYEHILDAVQSEQVERQDIPPRWKKIIEQEVRDEYGPGASQRMIRSEVDARQKEFKENPEINGRDLDRAEASISQFELTASPQESIEYRKEIMNELRNMKEIRFRLNGVGYAAALDSLEEQFPYYIHAGSKPKEEHLEEFERDMGYVEPARNRPTEAKAGWHGTQARVNAKSSGKYSAAYADHQAGLPGAPDPLGNRPGGGGSTASEATATTLGGSGTPRRPGEPSSRERVADVIAEAAEEAGTQTKLTNATVALQQAVKDKPPTGVTAPDWWSKDEASFRSWLDESPANGGKFHAYYDLPGNASAFATHAPAENQAYVNAKGTVSAKKYDPAARTVWPTHPYTFRGEGEAFKPGASVGDVDVQLRMIDGQTRGMTTDKPLSEMTEGQLQTEVEEMQKALYAKKKTLELLPNTTPDELRAGLQGYFANPGSAYVGNFLADDGAKHLKMVHQVRWLKRNPGTGTLPPQAPGGATGGAAGGSLAPQSPPVAPGGLLKPVAAPVPLTPEQQRGKADHVKKLRRHYVDQLMDEAKVAGDDDQQNKLYYAASEVKKIPVTEVNELHDMVAHIMIDEPDLLARIKQRVEQEPINQ